MTFRESPQDNVVLSVQHLTTMFRADTGLLPAVSDLSFELGLGETLGIVGESGCGKSVTCKSILRVLPEHLTVYGSQSRVILDGHDLLQASHREMRQLRGRRIAMIFQEPTTALNPVFTIGWQLEEVLKIHTQLARRDRYNRIVEMLERVEMPNPERRMGEYPHQLSGGMRQRVIIAMALICEPAILIADEPTTALDVTIQSQILRLLGDLKLATKLAVVFITHDLAVVAQVCDRVIVMYAGQMVEVGLVQDIFHRPQHPYTKALLDSIPKQSYSDADDRTRRLPVIEGVVPSLRQLPVGCRFHDRCDYSEARCREVEPVIESSNDGRQIRCHYPLQQNENPDVG